MSTTIDDIRELKHRVAVLETDIARLRADVVKYTEHAIVLMRTMSELAAEMQRHGMSTEDAAQHIRNKLAN